MMMGNSEHYQVKAEGVGEVFHGDSTVFDGSTS
jgi:hypothetical protein